VLVTCAEDAKPQGLKEEHPLVCYIADLTALSNAAAKDASSERASSLVEKSCSPWRPLHLPMSYAVHSISAGQSNFLLASDRMVCTIEPHDRALTPTSHASSTDLATNAESSLHSTLTFAQGYEGDQAACVVHVHKFEDAVVSTACGGHHFATVSSAGMPLRSHVHASLCNVEACATSLEAWVYQWQPVEHSSYCRARATVRPYLLLV
jgi:hypothetical protein